MRWEPSQRICVFSRRNLVRAENPENPACVPGAGRRAAEAVGSPARIAERASQLNAGAEPPLAAANPYGFAPSEVPSAASAAGNVH